jgi:GT2 family glycosyltransferase
MTPPSTRVAAVVVHYGDAGITRRAVASIAEDAPGISIVVVDNGGGPSLSLPQARVVDAGGNRGYGTACNLGARGLTAEFLLFANNDVTLLPGCLAALVAALDREPRAAAVGPRLLDLADAGIPSIFRAPTPRRILFENLFLPRLLPGAFFDGHHTVRLPHDAPREVETMSGALFLVRRAAFEAAGGFDEGYFFYAEESDLFARLRQAGWTVRFEPAARARHAGGAASAAVPQARRDLWLHDGLRRYARKFHGESGERLARVSLRLGARLRWLLSFLQPGEKGRSRRRRYADILHARLTDSSTSARGGSG